MISAEEEFQRGVIEISETSIFSFAVVVFGFALVFSSVFYLKFRESNAQSFFSTKSQKEECIGAILEGGGGHSKVKRKKRNPKSRRTKRCIEELEGNQSNENEISNEDELHSELNRSDSSSENSFDNCSDNGSDQGDSSDHGDIENDDNENDGDWIQIEKSRHKRSSKKLMSDAALQQPQNVIVIPQHVGGFTAQDQDQESTKVSELNDYQSSTSLFTSYSPFGYGLDIKLNPSPTLPPTSTSYFTNQDTSFFSFFASSPLNPQIQTV